MFDWLHNLHFPQRKQLLRLLIPRLQPCKLLLLSNGNPLFANFNLLILMQHRIFLLKLPLHRYKIYFNPKACSTGCSTCSSTAASACSACSSGYTQAGTYCCPTATPVLQDTTCQASCNANYFSSSNVCTGIIIHTQNQPATLAARPALQQVQAPVPPAPPATV